jgi:large conductance mechanosensitive channel protein
MAQKNSSVKKEVVAKRVQKAKAQLDKIPTDKVKKPLGGFVDFIREQGIVGLAIGFVIGAQSRTLVDQLVASFISPLLGLLLPGAGKLSERTFSVTLGGQTENFAWGSFLFELITFTIIAAVIYVVFIGLKLNKLDKKNS